MAVKVYHQVGHNSNWNVESFENEGVGDGLILSPVHQARSTVEKLDVKTRAASLFDPQFYLPSSQKPKLLQYDFFPGAITDGGFTTVSFEASVKEAAEKCVAFQKALGFRRVVVPTRFIDQMYSNYVDRQKAFSVDAFMAVLGAADEVCLSLAATSAMLEDDGFRTKLLSWITSYPNVKELYLTYFVPRDTKQIQSDPLLLACHQMGREAQEIGLELTWGHQNTEALLFTAQGDVAVSIGSFENTRIFSTDKFIVTDEDRRGPKARIYLRGLMNWIQIDQAKEIRQQLPQLWKQIYFPTKYAEDALAMLVDPTFNQPHLYKHYFQDIWSEIQDISTLDASERKEYLLARLTKAIAAYKQIGNQIALERHGQGSHLSSWLAAVTKFK